MTAGLARDRAEAWPVSPGVTAGDWKRHYLAPSQTQRPTADLIRTSFPSLFFNKEVLQDRVQYICNPQPIRLDQNRGWWVSGLPMIFSFKLSFACFILELRAVLF